ncbi:MAG: hypothetical protein HY794_12240 [Desulfarculus sp.]|nr:hypothetical protein [Desulfarculus sp.]
MRGDGTTRLSPCKFGLLLAVLSLALHLLAWPLVFRLIILPEARTDRQGLLVEEFATAQPGGSPSRVRHHPATRLELSQPDTSLRAHGLWRVKAAGFYQLEIQCDDYGSLSLDGRALISQEPATSSHNQGQARVFLEAGPHLLAVGLHNGPGSGWLTIRVAPAGMEPAPLPLEDVGFIDLGNLSAWLRAVAMAQVAGLAGLLAALLGLAGLAARQSPWPRPEERPGQVRAVSRQWHWFDGLPWGGGPEALVVAAVIPFLLLLDRGFLRRPLALALLSGLLLVKLALWTWAPASGWLLKAYEAPASLAAGQWEHTYETRWQPQGSGVLQGPLWEGADLPLAWQARKPISESERVGQPLILEVEGYVRLPPGAGLALVAAGASGWFTLSGGQDRPWRLPVAAGPEQVKDTHSGAWPGGKAALRGVISYDRRPWREWSLIPVLVEPGGAARVLDQGGVLWREWEGLDLSDAQLGLLNFLARFFDGGIVCFMLAWGGWALASARDRGLLRPCLLAASGMGLLLPWVLRGLGLESHAALICGLAGPLALLCWQAARQPGLAQAWTPALGRVALLALGPGLLGHFVLDWWPQAGQATLLSYGDDFGVYQLYAHKMAVEGDWWLRYMQFLHFQPLYPYIVSLLHVFFGQSMLAQGLLDVWAALGAAALLPVLARRMGCPAARGLAASAIYLAAELGPDFSWHLGRGLQEHTAMLFLLLTALAATSASGRTWTSALTAGLLALLTYLLRQDYAGALAGLGLWAATLRYAGGAQGWRGLGVSALRGWRWLLAYGLVLSLGPLLVLGRNKFIGGLAVLTNPGHIDHLLGATSWLHSMATILCVAPTPGYHCYAAWVLVPGALLGLAALVWRGWPLRGYPLALGVTLAGLLAPYLIIAPYAYEPRQSIHLLPLAALSLALAFREARAEGGRGH